MESHCEKMKEGRLAELLRQALLFQCVAQGSSVGSAEGSVGILKVPFTSITHIHN